MIGFARSLGLETLLLTSRGPAGYRSAPALGGIGAGSVELRSDGSFRQWTIFNQGPAGSGKYGIVDDVWMAVRGGGTITKILRTHPPSYASGQAVDSLTFGGSYPVTKLRVNDAALAATGLDLDLYAYSTLKPFSYESSGLPAVALTLVANNPHQSAAVPLDFMFTLPAGGWTDCSRHGDGKGGDSAALNYTACMHDCHNSATCQSWQFTGNKCTLNSDVPLTAHADRKSVV